MVAKILFISSKMIKKNCVFLLFVILSIGISAQDNNCVRKTKFGNAKICLPYFRGYSESLSIKKVKRMIKRTGLQTEMTLGYYLPDKVFKNLDKLSGFQPNDFINVYATKKFKWYEADNRILNVFDTSFNKNYVSKNWNTIKDNVENNWEGVDLGKPILLESYKLNDISRSYVMLASYSREGTAKHVVVMNLHAMIIKKRIIWFSYYLEYDGEESLSNAKEKGNLFLLRMLEVNE
jgi:hypothetical protein